MIFDPLPMKAKIEEKIVSELAARSPGTMPPKLVSVSTAHNEAAALYVQAQKKNAARLGIAYEAITTKDTITKEELKDLLDSLNKDHSTHGIILHTPFGRNIAFSEVVSYLAPEKDVEGVHPQNIGLLFLGNPLFVSPVARSCFEAVKASGVVLRGSEAVIIGHSNTVGKPLAALLLRELATVTICHIGTSEAQKLTGHISRAKILVVSVGKPEFIKGDLIPEQAVVIDVGINTVQGRIVGDIEFEKAKERASFITPVPGGIGSLTISLLFENLMRAYRIQHDSNV